MVGYHELHNIVRDTLFHGGGGGMVSLPMLGTGNQVSTKRTFDLIGFRSPDHQRGYPWDRMNDLLNNLSLDEEDVEIVTRGYGTISEDISNALRARGWQRELRPAMNWWMSWQAGIMHDYDQGLSIRHLPDVTRIGDGRQRRRITVELLAQGAITGSFFVLMLPPIVELGEEVPSFIGRDW